MELSNILLIAAASALGFAASWAMARIKTEKLAQEKTILATKLEAAELTLDDLRDEVEHAKSEKTAFHERVITAEAKNKNLEQELEKTEARLRVEFQNTANTIFEKFTTKFSTESEKKIGDLLSPLRERLGDFQKMITDSFSAQGKEQHTLKAEIEKIVLQTDGLTKALRGDVKAQGNWGEVMLERILERSGLKCDIDYIVQATGMGLTNTDGGRLQPDVIVNLPENKHIIIDSKVSLTAYERYCNEADETARGIQAKEFIRSIKAHVNGLESKHYQNIEKINSPDFVLMFLPIEGAYSLAVQADSELHQYAWGKKIVLVCPTTLFATLRTIASIWKMEQQNKNTLEIARQGGALYDKFHGFLGDMENIGQHITRLHSAYESGMGKLQTGRGNLISQVEKLKTLGAKASKSLPKAEDELLESMSE